MTSSSSPRISGVRPLWAVEGGFVTIEGRGFAVDPVLPRVLIGGSLARLASASSSELNAIVPANADRRDGPHPERTAVITTGSTKISDRFGMATSRSAATATIVDNPVSASAAA